MNAENNMPTKEEKREQSQKIACLCMGVCMFILAFGVVKHCIHLSEENATLKQQLVQARAEATDLQKKLDEATGHPVSAPASTVEPEATLGDPQFVGDIQGMDSPCNWSTDLWPLWPELRQMQVCQVGEK